MALSHSPKIVTDGLVLCLDAGNSKSYKTDNNILNPGTWVSGTTGSQPGFTINGSTNENSIITGTDPFGNTAVLWEAVPDNVSGPDGGWNGDFFPIDHTKKYRFSVWVNRTILGSDGRFYFGLEGFDSNSSDVGVIIKISGNNSTNPYFAVSSSPPEGTQLPSGQWILVVGHVWPSGTATGDNDPDTGYYTTDGTKLDGAVYDFIWNTTVTQSRHRSYLFYTTDTGVRQRWAYPRVDLVDGTEPSISDLINNRVNSRYSYDLSGQNNHGTLLNGVSHASANSGYFDFDGSDDFIGFDYDLRSDWTYECWVNKDAKGGFAFLGNGTPSARNGLHIVMYDDRLRFGMYSNDTDAVGLFSNTSTGVWYHYAFSYDHSTYVKKIYRNGVSLSVTPVQTQSAYQGTGTVRIGANYSSGNYGYANGKISNSKLYNRVLTDVEVAQNFNALRGRFGI